MKWLGRILRIEEDSGEIKRGNVFYGKENLIYRPVRGYPGRIWAVSNNSYDYAQAEKEAELLRKRILDEDTPLNFSLGLEKPGHCYIDGGRISDAMLLGMIRYSEACPELLEAASHDLDEYMRDECVKALGEMEAEAFKCAEGICEILMKDNLYVKRTASKALGKIGNSVAIASLRNVVDDMMPVIREYEREVYVNGKSDLRSELYDACHTLENAIVSIFALDPLQGRETLAEGLKDASPSVRHHSKNAAFWKNFIRIK
jgi:HEAT repeat protein